MTRGGHRAKEGRRWTSFSTAALMPRGWSMLTCSVIDRCMDKCKRDWSAPFNRILASHGGICIAEIVVVFGV